jgi:hypothetical protein
MDEEGDMGAALASFRAAVKFDPQSEAAWSNLAIALQDEANPDAAKDAEEAKAAEQQAVAVTKKKGKPLAPLTKSASNTQGTLHFYNLLKTWDEAEEFCRTRGGALATLKTPSQQNNARSKCVGNRCWLGLTDRKIEGDHRWADGSKPGSHISHWVKKEPNNAYGRREQDCCYIWGKGGYGRDGQWGDGECDRKMAFLCDVPEGAKEAVSVNPDGTVETSSIEGGSEGGSGDGALCSCRPKQSLAEYEKEHRCHTHLYEDQIRQDLAIWAAEPGGTKISREYTEATEKKGGHLRFIVKEGKLYSKVSERRQAALQGVTHNDSHELLTLYTHSSLTPTRRSSTRHLSTALTSSHKLALTSGECTVPCG